MSNYYLDESYNDFYLYDSIWKYERERLASNNARLLDIKEANELNLQHFIYKNAEDDKPHLNQDYLFLTIPYELDDEIFSGNEDLNASVLISNVFNKYMNGKPLYLASTDHDLCCVVKAKYLNESIIFSLTSPHMNTPFLIFNEDAEIFALIDYDLPLQIIGYKPHLQVEIEHYDVIQQGFNDVMERYASYGNMPYLFRTYYDFLLPKWFKY